MNHENDRYMNIELIVNGKLVGTFGSMFHALNAYREMIANHANIVSAKILGDGRLVQVII